MKNKKTAVMIILMTVLAVTACVQYDPESDFRIQPFDYVGKVEIYDYLGNKQVVRIPPKIKNQPVTHIMKSSFEEKQLTSVTIPNTVIMIEENAFADNQLTKVTIPNSVNVIGWGAFKNNQLTNITIPNSVKEIAFYAFDDNPLTSITIPSNVAVGRWAFPGDFVDVYEYTGKPGGTYRKDSNNNWRKE
jgi:hypothetical protein